LDEIVAELQARLREKENALAKISQELDNLDEFKVHLILITICSFTSIYFCACIQWRI